MEISKFMSEMFGQVDVFTDENGEIWFSGNQVAEALGYDKSNLANAVRRFTEEEDRKALKYKASLDSNEAVLWIKANDYSDKLIINEPGLYSMISSSRLPKAKEFKHWVTHEVLPSIRKNGGYIEGEEELSKEDRAKIDEEIKNLRSKVARLQKRRHELLAEQRKDRKTISGLNDYADLYEELYDRLVRENAELTQQIFDLRFPDAREGKEQDPEPKRRYVITDAQGFIVGAYER